MSNIENYLGLILVIIWFSSVPVLKAQRPSSRHPDKLSLLSLVSPGCPEVFITEADSLDVFLQQLLLCGRVNTGQVEAVIPAVLS